MKLKSLSNRILAEINTKSSGTKIWNSVTSLAASMENPINLGQGWPDTEINSVAKQHAINALDDQRANQYSLIPGDLDLRKSLANFYKKLYVNELDADKNIVITSSGSEGLYCTIQTLISEGDEVIVFEPFFPFYINMIRLAGGRIKAVGLDAKNNFKINEKELSEAFSDKTKLVIFNTPHNPTGHMATKEEIQLLSKLCVKYNSYCISDEVYETFIFDKDLKHLRICDEPDMANRTITIGSASKQFSVTGWRLGWAYSLNEDLINGIKLIHGQTSYCAPTVFQRAVKEALDTSDKDLNAELNELYFENAKILADALAKKYNIQSYIPSGGYFLVCDISNTNKTDVEFCEYLAKTKKVIAVPMQVFYHKNIQTNLIRFAICKTRKVIDQAADAILSSP